MINGRKYKMVPWIKLETDAKKVALRYKKKLRQFYENKGDSIAQSNVASK